MPIKNSASLQARRQDRRQLLASLGRCIHPGTGPALGNRVGGVTAVGAASDQLQSMHSDIVGPYFGRLYTRQ
jgi:hypothetical protein